MIVSQHHIDPFLKRIPEHVRVVLLHGPDTGLASERLHLLTVSFLGSQHDNPFSISRLSSDEITKTPSILTEELFSLTLSSDRRCIQVHGYSSELAKIISGCPETLFPDTLLIFCTGLLKPAAALRKFCETRPDCAAIPCYPDGEKELLSLISTMLAADAIQIDRDTARFLASQLGENRLASRMEIEKLRLYLYGQDTASMEAVHAIVGDVSAFAIDDVLDALALGYLRDFETLFSRCLASGYPANRILTAAIRHFSLLQALRTRADAGQELSSAIKTFRPSIFFKRHDAINRQCRIWSCSQLCEALHKLADAELDSRAIGHPRMAHQVIARALLSLSVRARQCSRSSKPRRL